jgi:hypothetical protein
LLIGGKTFLHGLVMSAFYQFHDVAKLSFESGEQRAHHTDALV